MARLADRANDEDMSCWPSIKRICLDCCLSERAVQKHIRDLQANGFLSVKDGGGRHQVNEYVPFPEKKDGENTVHHKPRIRNPVSGAEKGARRAGNGAPRAPQPKGTQKNPKGGAPRFEREIKERIETARREQNRLFMKSALENSITGTTWRSERDRLEYEEWKRAERADLEALRNLAAA